MNNIRTKNLFRIKDYYRDLGRVQGAVDCKVKSPNVKNCNIIKKYTFTTKQLLREE